MDNRLQTDIWVHRVVIVLSSIVVVSVIGAIALTITGWFILKILVAFGVVAIAGLVRLLISPLNQGLLG